MNILDKIQSIVNSCVTYEQLQSCLNIVNNLQSFEHKIAVTGFIQTKMYKMRNDDLKHHISELEKISSNKK